MRLKLTLTRRVVKMMIESHYLSVKLWLMNDMLNPLIIILKYCSSVNKLLK